MRARILGGLVVAAIVLAGCPRPVPPSGPGSTTLGTLPSCPATAPTADAVCDGLFTAEAFACVRCPGVAGCIDNVDRIYCVVGACLDDTRCRLEGAGAPDAGLAGSRRNR